MQPKNPCTANNENEIVAIGPFYFKALLSKTEWIKAWSPPPTKPATKA